MIFEARFIYFPYKFPEGDWSPFDPAAGERGIEPRVEDCELTAEDGVKLHGWYCSMVVPGAGEATGDATGKDAAGTESPARPVMLFLHGNAGNITHRRIAIESFVRAGVDVFIFDYRGYGRSEGSASEEGVYRDAAAAWRYLTDERTIAPDRIVLFGRSLGAAVAIELATQEGEQSAGVVIESAFTSIRDMAPPVIGRLLRTKMDSINKVASIHMPKLFVHSNGDEIIPYRQGRRLYERAAAPKDFYTIQGAGHNDTDIIGGAAYYEAVCQFVFKCAGQNTR